MGSCIQVNLWLKIFLVIKNRQAHTQHPSDWPCGPDANITKWYRKYLNQYHTQDKVQSSGYYKFLHQSRSAKHSIRRQLHRNQKVKWCNLIPAAKPAVTPTPQSLIELWSSFSISLYGSQSAEYGNHRACHIASHCKGNKNQGNLITVSHCSQRIFPNELPCNQTIRYVIQLLENNTSKQWQAESPENCTGISCGEICSFMIHISSLFVFIQSFYFLQKLHIFFDNDNLSSQ